MSNDYQKVATVAERLQEAMRIRRKRQADLVKDTGIAKGTISNYIKGKYEPKSPTMQKLAQALNVSEKWLNGYDVPMGRMTIKSKETKTIGKNIQMLREKCNLSQKELSELLGVEESVVHAIESGEYAMSREMQFRVSKIFYASPDILDGTIFELIEQGDVDAEYRFERHQKELENNPPSPEEEDVFSALFDQLSPEDQNEIIKKMLEMQKK